ncbi:olfactory receptor 52K2-like [Ciconia boyciana]|uniref:olfactory receptor 52K2-like n=1 Tax=Ciconia boyciana TaxID=52775 RepID=UPI003B9EB066
MSTANRSNTNSSSFLLMGIPGLEALHMWFSIPFCFTYIMTLLGNSMVLLAVRLNKSLHEPMYYFISMLAVIDLIFSTAVVPKMLGVFWLDSREIGFEACFIQMFFIHTFTAVESGVLLAMSFDRYIAICNPLRYTTILTSSRTIQMGLLSLARGAGVMTPLMCLLTSLPYCKTRVIPHSYCEHMAVVELACTDPSVSDLYSLIVATLLVGTDSVFITFSYGMILRSVMRLPSQEARLKALRTCGSHVSIILLFYIGGLLSMYLQMFSFGLAPHVQVLVADFYLTVPPMLNPLIYGIKMKQIQEGIFKLLGSWQDSVSHKLIKTANSIPTYTVGVEEDLRSPMYSLITLLLTVPLCSSSTFVPKMLLGFLFHLSHISWGGCVAQICCDDPGIRGAPVPLERHQALCEQMALVSLSRGDTSRNKMDNPYSPENCTWEMQRKACHTSATRLVVIPVTDLSSSTVCHTGKSVSEDVHNLISVTYLLLPCGINPIIYGVRTKEIREHLLKLLKKEILMHDHGQGHGCSLKISLSQSKLLLLRKDGPFLSRSYPPPPICWHEQSQGSTVHSNKSDSFLD